MKPLRPILLVTLLFCTNGCITYSTVKRATGEANALIGKPADQPQSGYYALLPLTVMADIVSFPFQLAFIVILQTAPSLGGEAL